MEILRRVIHSMGYLKLCHIRFCFFEDVHEHWMGKSVENLLTWIWGLRKEGPFWFSTTKLSKSGSSRDTKAGLVSAGSFYQVRKERRSGRLPKKGVGRRRLTCLEHVWYNVVPPAYRFILSIHLTTLIITNKLLRNHFVCLVMACDLKLSTKKIKSKKGGSSFFACVRSKRRAA